MQAELTDDSLITRAASISWCDMGEEVVVLRVTDQAYYRFRGSARTLWLRLEEPQSLSALVEGMMVTHDGSPGIIAAETRTFVEECAELDLVRLAHAQP